VEYRPFFLRPDTPLEGAPVPAYVKARMGDPNNPLKLRAREAGVPIVDRDMMYSTWRAHEASEYARSQGKLDAFYAALMRRSWAEGQNISAWETIQGAAAEVGLDPEETKRAVEEGRYRSTVEEGVREAHSLGVEAVPTSIVANRFVIQGAQSYTVWKQAMERLGAKPRGG